MNENVPVFIAASLAEIDAVEELFDAVKIEVVTRSGIPRHGQIATPATSIGTRGHSMVSGKLPSLRLLAAGWAFFVAFALVLMESAPHDEASLLTRAIVFMALIPPPVCFAAGIGVAFKEELRTTTAGVWVNGAAIFVHGIAAIAILQKFLA